MGKIDFSDLQISEKKLLDAIFRQIESGNISHSYIIEGADSEMRLCCAKLIACALVCENKKDGKPCRECRPCSLVLSECHSDVVICGKNIETSFKIDEIRKIRNDVFVMPSESDFHIYILDNADKMTIQAQNALLKVLEEPPEEVVFILLASSKNSLLPTVISRAQTHTLGNCSRDELEKYLRIQNPAFTVGQCARLSRFLAVSDKISHTERNLSLILTAAETAEKFYIGKKLNVIDEFPKKTEELLIYLKFFSAAARDISVYKKAPECEFFAFENRDSLKKACLNFSISQSMRLYEMFSNACGKIQMSGNINAIFAYLRANIITVCL